VGEDTVKNFVSGAVAAYGDETAVILLISLASEIGSMPRTCGGDNVNVETVFAQARDRWAS
jgi:hypothetical protein